MNWFARKTSHFLWIDKADGFSESRILDAWKKKEGLEAHSWPPDQKIPSEVSGAHAFPLTPDGQELLQVGLREKKVLRRFWFLTRQATPLDEVTCNDPRTDLLLKRIKRSPFFEVWEGESRELSLPQIRERLTALGRSVLGDPSHPHDPFCRFALHITRLHLPGEEPWDSAPPRLFERLGLLVNTTSNRALAAIDRRQRIFRFLAPENRLQILRLIDDEFLDLQMHALGPVLWGTWKRNEVPTQRQLETWSAIARIVGRPLCVNKDSSLWISGDTPKSWHARLEDRVYEFHLESPDIINALLATLSPSSEHLTK